MRTLLRSSLALAGALACSPLLTSAAHAGGLGFFGAGGLYSGKAYYYDVEGNQGVDSQLRPNTAAGFEAILGDGDDKVQGIMRLYASFDAPLKDPDVSGEGGGTFSHPDYASLTTRTVGVMTVGVQWGILGDPRGFQFGVTSLIGSGFWTQDQLEYFIAEPGAFVTYGVTDQFQLMGNVSGQVRFRKQFAYGTDAYIGVRYLFD
jgi:hypothetical protein